MKYPLVIWDSGGTIFNTTAQPTGLPSPRDIRRQRASRAAHFLEMYGHKVPASLEATIDATEKESRARLGAWHSLEKLAAALYDQFGIASRGDERLMFADALGGPRYREWLWDGVADALAALHAAGVRQSLLVNSDWTGRMMRRAYAGVGLAQYFETFTCSCDVGADKPDPRIFAAGQPALPGAILYVGDDVVKDVEGATAFGWDAALHLTGAAAGPTRAVVTFRDYRELTQFVLNKEDENGMD
ncbi:MAG: Phosphoglycolate phosphatase [Verrucomicrobiae bacterium]|nr:Phosphoglycolate phosphatase [Verrucomicrobiae bacterium]